MKAYFTYAEVRAASLDYFNGDEMAAEIVASKYLLQDLHGRFYELTPTDMHWRLANELARIEAKYPNPLSADEIFGLLSGWDVVLQGGPMSGIGNPFQLQSISNCFVVGAAEDSYGGIFHVDEEAVQVQKRRGGVGHDISNIRPKGLPAANAARTTDGIGVFMDRFSNSTREVAQGGRRGALMLTISVHHPEIRTFINIKKDKKRVTGANISIRITDEFMDAVNGGEKYQLRFPVVKEGQHSVEEWIDAREIWDEIMQAAWESAEPGVLFWDTIINESPADCYADVGYGTESTNPCGELPLCRYDSCRLALLNLKNFVLNPFTQEALFDFERFRETVKKAQRLMDDVVDLELEMIDKILAKIETDSEPEHVKRVERELWQKIKKTTAGGRRTGLGVTALGDTLAMLNIKYGCDEAVLMTEAIYRELAHGSYHSSGQMAQERGPFPVYDYVKEKDHPFIQRVMALDSDLAEMYATYGRRNIANLTTAPAGTVSTVTQSSSGGEPVIYISYKRRRKITAADKQARVDFVDEMGDRWQEYPVYHHGVLQWMKVTGKTDVTESPYWGATAEEIDWVKKVDMQAAAQRWIDHSISNTTNLPKDATVEDVKRVYQRGWETGCKGITIYRAGSRAGVIVKLEASEGKSGREGAVIADSHAPKRPLELPCELHRASVQGKQYLILVGLLNGRPYEVFAGLAENVEVGKKETKGVLRKHPRKTSNAVYDLIVGEETFKDVVQLFDNPTHGAFTRTLSTALRHGVPVQYLVEQLRKDKHSEITSFSSVIARVFSKTYIADGTQASGATCGACGSTQLAYEQGCVTCLDCRYSKCG